MMARISVHRDDKIAHSPASDVSAWVFNVTSSVLIVFVNKLLMDSRGEYKFVFATTLCALHFFACALTLKSFEVLGFTQPAKLPWGDRLFFSFMAGLSIASLNLSLLINTVGFYQIAKLLIIPFVCLVEIMWMRRGFNNPVLLSIITVVAGVAIVTITDLRVGQVSLFGMMIAAVSVVSSGLQQILCGYFQKKHGLTSNQMLSNTAPVQGLMLLLVGPYLDLQVSGKWILAYEATVPAMMCLALSCGVSVLVNISQFMCLGRFRTVTFQVLGHTKTVLVLALGWFFLNDIITGRKLLGMLLAVAGMVAYGYLSSKVKPVAQGTSDPGHTR